MSPQERTANEKQIKAIEKAEEILAYAFQDRNLLLEALTHSSYANEKGGTDNGNLNNERLEFLGDAVLGLGVALKLMQLFPRAQEGALSRWRSGLVSRKALAEVAIEKGFGDWVLLGRGEKNTGGSEKRSILAGVFEAVIGALYLDGGFKAAQDFLDSAFESHWKELTEGNLTRMRDSKTELQEKVQEKYHQIPIYQIVESWGAEHAKTFRVEITLGARVLGTGEGKSKKAAEQDAARNALENGEGNWEEPKE